MSVPSAQRNGYSSSLVKNGQSVLSQIDVPQRKTIPIGSTNQNYTDDTTNIGYFNSNQAGQDTLEYITSPQSIVMEQSKTSGVQQPLQQQQHIGTGLPRIRIRHENSAVYARDVLRKPEVQENHNDVKIEKKMKLLEGNAKYFEQQAHPLFVENSQLKDQIIELNELIRERTKDYSSLLRDFSMKGESRDIAKKIGDLETIYLCIKEDFGFYETTVQMLREDKAALEGRVGSLEERLSNQDKMNANRMGVLETEYRQLIDSLKKQIEDQAREIERMKISMSGEQSSYQKALSAKDAENTALKKQLLELMEKSQRTEERLREQIKQLEKQIEKLHELHEKEKKTMQAQFAASLASLREYYENKISTTVAEFEARIKELSDEIAVKNTQIDSLTHQLETSRESARQLAEQLQTARAEVAMLEGKNASLTEKLAMSEQKLQSLQQEHSKLIGENARMKDTMTKDQNQLGALEEMLRNLHARIRQLEADLVEKERMWQKRFDEEVARRELELEQKLAQMKEGFEKRIKDITSNYESKMSELQRSVKMLQDEAKYNQMMSDKGKNDLADRLLDLQESMNSKMNDMKLQYEDMLSGAEKRRIQELQDMEKRKQAEMDEMRRNAAEKQRELEEKMKSALEEKDRLFESMKAELEGRLAALDIDWKFRFAQMERQYKERIAELEDMLKRADQDKQRELNELKKRFEQQMETMKSMMGSNTKDQLNELRGQLEQETQKLREKHLRDLKERDEEWSKKMKKMGEDFEREKREWEQRTREYDEARLKQEAVIRQLREEILVLSHELSKLKRIVSEQMQELANLQQTNLQLLSQNKMDSNVFVQQVAEMQEKLAREKQELIDMYERREKELKAQLEEELNAALLNHVEILEAMKREYDELIRAHQLRTELLKSEYRELERLFNERPSRPEDIRQIKLLLKEIEALKKSYQESEIRVLHANEIVKYLQLELENYKSVYDIFGPGKKPTSNSDMVDLAALLAQQQQQQQQNDQNTGGQADESMSPSKKINLAQYQRVNKQSPLHQKGNASPLKFKGRNLRESINQISNQDAGEPAGDVRVLRRTQYSTSKQTQQQASQPPQQQLYQSPLEDDDIMRNAEKFIVQIQEGQNSLAADNSGGTYSNAHNSVSPSRRIDSDAQRNSNLRSPVRMSTIMSNQQAEQEMIQMQQAQTMMDKDLSPIAIDKAVGNAKSIQLQQLQQYQPQQQSTISYPETAENGGTMLKQTQRQRAISRNKIQQSLVLDASINGSQYRVFHPVDNEMFN